MTEDTRSEPAYGHNATGNSTATVSMLAKEVRISVLAEWGRGWVALQWGREVVLDWSAKK